jgi:hypothetical protein
VPANRRHAAPEWAGLGHELKHDGYRLQIHVRDGRVRLYTINGADWSKRYPLIICDAAKIKGSAIIDAEVVWLDSTDQADHDQRTFECSNCAYAEVVPVKYAATRRWSSIPPTERTPSEVRQAFGLCVKSNFQARRPCRISLDTRIPPLDQGPVQKAFEFLANALVSVCDRAGRRYGPNLAGRARGADLHQFGMRCRANCISRSEVTMALSDRDLIGVTFEYVDGRFLEVTGVHPKFPGAILYRDLTTDAEGTMLSIYVRQAKQREHLENLERERDPVEETG